MLNFDKIAFLIVYFKLNNIIMKQIKSILLKVSTNLSYFGAFGVYLLTGFFSPVLSQSESNPWIPDWIQKIIDSFGFSTGTADPVEQVRKRVQWAITILFIVVFIIAIVYSALAAIKFISSQGDASKLEESKGAVKAILMGFAAMLISIIGIFFIVWLFNRSSQIQTEPEDPTW